MSYTENYCLLRYFSISIAALANMPIRQIYSLVFWVVIVLVLCESASSQDQMNDEDRDQLDKTQGSANTPSTDTETIDADFQQKLDDAEHVVQTQEVDSEPLKEKERKENGHTTESKDSPDTKSVKDLEKPLSAAIEEDKNVQTNNQITGTGYSTSAPTTNKQGAESIVDADSSVGSLDNKAEEYASSSQQDHNAAIGNMAENYRSNSDTNTNSVQTEGEKNCHYRNFIKLV